MPLVVQELPTIPGYLCSPCLFWGSSCALPTSIYLLSLFNGPLYCLFLFRFMASDYPFGIIKLSLMNASCMIYLLHVSSIIKRGLECHLTNLTPPHMYACPKPGPGFSTPCVLVVFCVKLIEKTVVVPFVDIF